MSPDFVTCPICDKEKINCSQECEGHFKEIHIDNP